MLRRARVGSATAHSQVSVRCYSGKAVRRDIKVMKEIITNQKELVETFHPSTRIIKVGGAKIRVPKGGQQHPTPNWLGAPTDKILYDKGKCKMLYMNDGAHGNVLNPEMITSMHSWLGRYENEDPGHTSSLIIRGKGTRFFSTGYDMKMMYDSAVAAASLSAKENMTNVQHNRELTRRASTGEYIPESAYRPTKPEVSGIRANTMGGLHLSHLIFYTKNLTMSLINGGSGAAFLHTPIVIATEASVFTAPYCEVGWFPDCGVTKILASLPNYLGYYLALTGARLSGADLYHAGLATHYIPLHTVEVLKRGLDTVDNAGENDKIFLILEAAQQQRLPPFSFPKDQLDVIKKVFSLPSIERILGALDEMQTGFSIVTATRIRKNSPVATKVTFELLNRAKELPLFKVLENDWSAAYRLARLPDIKEGLRAWVHGDDRPNWHWPRIENIPKDEMDLLLSPLPEQYRYRPISEGNQSSEMHLDVESEFMEFSKGWHQLMTDGKPPKKLWTDFVSTANVYGTTAARQLLEKRGYTNLESYEDRRIAFGEAEELYKKHLPYVASAWAERHDVKQRAATKAGLEVQRAEREREAHTKARLKFEEEYKKTGGEELNLAEADKEDRDVDDPYYIQPDAHDSKTEEMLEQMFDGQIDTISEDHGKEFPEYDEFMGPRTGVREGIVVPRVAALF